MDHKLKYVNNLELKNVQKHENKSAGSVMEFKGFI